MPAEGDVSMEAPQDSPLAVAPRWQRHRSYCMKHLPHCWLQERTKKGLKVEKDEQSLLIGYTK